MLGSLFPLQSFVQENGNFIFAFSQNKVKVYAFSYKMYENISVFDPVQNMKN